jgi:hypothetical protein
LKSKLNIKFTAIKFNKNKYVVIKIRLVLIRKTIAPEN